MDEAIEVSCIIDKLPPFWKEFKQTLKHKKEELTLFELSSHLRIEESLGVKDSDKPKGKNVVGLLVFNMMKHNNSTRYNDNKGKRKHHDNTRTDPNKKVEPTCWKCGKTGHIKRDFKGVNVCNKSNGSSTKGLVDGRGCVDLRDAIFDKNRFSSVPRLSLKIPNGTKDIGSSVVPEEVFEEVVQQPKLEFRKSKKNKIPKNFRPELQLYLIEGTKYEKEAIYDEMDSVMGNNTWVLAHLPPSCKPLGCKWIFKRKLKTAFLNGELDKEVYVNQPQGFIMRGNENKYPSKKIHRICACTSQETTKIQSPIRYMAPLPPREQRHHSLSTKHNGTSRARSTETSDGLAAIQAQLNNLGREIKKDKVEYKGKNVVGAFMNLPIFVGNFSVVTNFAVVENMDGYRDQDIGDVILGEPFCKASCVEARRFDGLITIHNYNDNVTYQMA
uniref:Zinc finger, CCHC-type n=1 Tax=Tanacetum cinerariifolium TaxID=118510 RepID=A0A6L2L2W0_TANCI|nr:zinc finger, CCHC-type [Tanacetum cinerariifolium]